MGKRMRRNFSPALKARVCIEAIREEKSLAELASQYNVHQNVIRAWKKQFLDNACQVFEKGNKKNPAEEREPELYKQIGQMKVENDWLKKKLGLLNLV